MDIGDRVTHGGTLKSGVIVGKLIRVNKYTYSVKFDEDITEYVFSHDKLIKRK